MPCGQHSNEYYNPNAWMDPRVQATIKGDSMPCHDPRSDQAIRDQKIELDKVTRLLCFICNKFKNEINRLRPRLPNDEKLILELNDWIDDHKEMDTQRMNELLAELDSSERALLKELLEDD